MMTTLELLNRLENARGDYDAPILICRPVVGQGVHTFHIVDISHDPTDPADDELGALVIIISRDT